MTKRYKEWVSRPLFPEALARLAQHVELDAEAVERVHAPEALRERLAGVDAAIIPAQEFLTRCQHPPTQKPFDLVEIVALLQRLVTRGAPS